MLVLIEGHLIRFEYNTSAVNSQASYIGYLDLLDMPWIEVELVWCCVGVLNNIYFQIKFRDRCDKFYSVPQSTWEAFMRRCRIVDQPRGSKTNWQEEGF